MRTMTILLLAGLTASAGCLEAGQRGTSGTVGDAGTDTTTQTDGTSPDAAGPDAAPDVPPPPPPPVCPDTCTDDNDCTEDFCDELTGQCQHVSRPDGSACGYDGCGSCDSGECWEVGYFPGPANECWADADCDDGDPCTEDICYCEYAEGEICYGGDIEYCWCEHVYMDGCEESPQAACNGQGAQSMWDVLTSYEVGNFVKIAGTAAMGPYGVCDDSECGNCDGDLALYDSPGYDYLTMKPEVDGAAWNCVSGGCPVLSECQPMQDQAKYWAWGTTEYYDPWGGGNVPWGGDGEADVAYYPMALKVQGFCLQTTHEGLPGVYEGQIQHDWGWTYPVTLTITSDGDNYSVHMSALSPCSSCEFQAAQDASDVWVGDGNLGFGADVPAGDYSYPSNFQLQSSGNTLSGWFFANDWYYPVPPPPDGDGVAQPSPGGSITVTRVAD